MDIILNGKVIYGMSEQILNDEYACSILGIVDKDKETVRNEILWYEVRTRRDALIAATDWTQVPDAVISAEKKAEFAAYRQALRDIPQTFKKPDEVDWPPVPVL
ncbi:tail fiber assembly protein [Aeromonas caviae]|uniref:tail fiber assembly protein n=1 Tax=Aeromonas caviae TaxID=648 RepID=UPI002541049D|nr:tail fiber assembly protein [Aeromonas caviae]MDK3165621.1 tail fiber assembly protein [Aeromonas caviae]WNV60219.1 hypothetical protein LNGCBEGE_00023 [Aeromonas caviae]